MPDKNLYNSEGGINWNTFSSRYKSMPRSGGGPRDLYTDELDYLKLKLEENGFVGDTLNVLMANAIEESGGNPKESTGNYNGLFQIDKRHYLVDKSKTNNELIDEQVDYLKKHLNTVGDRGFLSGRRNSDGDDYRYGKDDHAAPKNEFWADDTSLENRMYAFVNGFERPGNRKVTYQNRLGVAKILSEYGIYDKPKEVSDYIMEELSGIPKFEDGGEKKPWRPSKEILDYIMDTEKFRSKVYKDGNDIETIGYGFTDPEIIKKYNKKGSSMSKKEANRIFKDELVPEFTEYLVNSTENFDELNDNQKDALFSYIYNIGYGNYVHENPNLHKALSKKDWKSVAKNIDFGYNDEDNKGLRKRRNYERELFGFSSDENGDVYPLDDKSDKPFFDFFTGGPMNDRSPLASAVKMMFPVTYTIVDEIYGRLTDTPTDLNKALYSSVDPTGGKPDGLLDVLRLAGKAVSKYTRGDFSDVDYPHGEDASLPRKVSIAAWAKYNKLPYDESLIIDNGDGTYRIPREIEEKIITSRSDIEKSVNINKKKLDKIEKEYNDRYDAAMNEGDLSSALNILEDRKNDKGRIAYAIAYLADSENIESIDKVLSGNSAVFNELNYKGRNLVDSMNDDGSDASPLNVLGNYTMYKDNDGNIKYKDIWDLDVFGIPIDKIIGGKPFDIHGVAGKSGKKKMEYGGTTRDEAEDYIFSYLTSNGFKEPQAIAIIANLIGESGLQANITRKGGSDFGLQQWIGPRKKALYEYAREMGHEEPTFDDQLDFLIKEYKGEVPGSGWNFQTKGMNLHKGNPDKFGKEWDYYQYGRSEFENADSVANATVMYNQGFGRAYKQNLRNDFRIKQAERLAEKFGLDMGLPESDNEDMSSLALAQNTPDQILPESDHATSGEDRFDRWFEDYGRDFVGGVDYGRIGDEVSSSLQPLISKMGSVAAKENKEEDNVALQNRDAIIDSMVNEALAALNFDIKGMSKEKG